MTLTSPISHKNPTLAKVQMAQHRMRSIALCSWALLPQARSAHDAATSAQSISGDWDETLRASGSRRGNRGAMVSSYSQSSASSCWVPVVCNTSLDSQRECCVLSCRTSGERWHPHPWSTCYRWIKEGGTFLFPPTLLCQHLLFRAGSLWKTLEHV